MIKREIKSEDDIRLLVDSFYLKVLEDDLLSPVFNSTENFNWETHIPVMYRFWESLLLGKAGYRGNPVKTHVELNKRIPLSPNLFHRWKALFFATLDEHFAGTKVNEAKSKVEAMEILMLTKIEASKNPGFIQ